MAGVRRAAALYDARRPTMRCMHLAPVITLVWTCTGCQLFSPHPTAEQMSWTPGRATPELAARVEGSIVGHGEFLDDALLTLPHSSAQKIHVPSGTSQISGPDADGSFAILVKPFFAHDHLSLLRANGTEAIVNDEVDLDPWSRVALASCDLHVQGHERRRPGIP